MTVKEYRDAAGVNYSSLKHILTSTSHYLANVNAVVEETTPMRLGTMLHSWWLEGKDDVLGDAVIKPADMNFSTKEGKEWRAKNEGKFIITADEWAQFLKRQAALKSSVIAQDWLSVLPDREKPMFGEVNGVRLKALFDASSKLAFIDLKTCQKNDPRSWGETVMDRHYDFQAALYAAVWRCNYEGNPKFNWITVSDDAHPVVAVYEREPFVASGDEKLERAIRAYKELVRYGEQPLTAEMPYWATRK